MVFWYKYGIAELRHCSSMDTHNFVVALTYKSVFGFIGHHSWYSKNQSQESVVGNLFVCNRIAWKFHPVLWNVLSWQQILIPHLFTFLTYIYAPLYCSYATKKPDLSTWQIRFLCVMRSLRNVMHTACVMQASPVMHAFGALCGTHRITYHSEAASLITYLQNNLIYGII